MSTLPLVGAIIWICCRSAFIGMLSPTIMLFGINCFLSSRFSSRNRLASIAFLIRIRVLSMESGFSRKSYAPSLVARTAVSMVPCPEIMMTSGAFSFSRIFSSVSKPSIPGSQTSSRTTSNTCLLMISRPASPLSAIDVLKPSSSRTPLSDWRMVGSSSTMRMLCMLIDGGCGNGFGHNRQFHHKPGADRLILFYANRAVMIFDDAVYDGKSKTGSAFLGGEVRQEQALLQLASHAVASIGDDDLHHVAAMHQSGGNLNLPKQRILHRFGSIVYQVGKGSLDSFGVRQYVGQLWRQNDAHSDIIQSSIEHRESAFHDRVNIGRLRSRRRETGQCGEFIH